MLLRPQRLHSFLIETLHYYSESRLTDDEMTMDKWAITLLKCRMASQIKELLFKMSCPI